MRRPETRFFCTDSWSRISAVREADVLIEKMQVWLGNEQMLNYQLCWIAVFQASTDVLCTPQTLITNETYCVTNNYLRCLTAQGNGGGPSVRLIESQSVFLPYSDLPSSEAVALGGFEVPYALPSETECPHTAYFYGIKTCSGLSLWKMSGTKFPSCKPVRIFPFTQESLLMPQIKVPVRRLTGWWLSAKESLILIGFGTEMKHQ
ncbi:uncharacterized protein LOC114812935 [Ornithorhynchus anatinus]|uniref:uncharacterized protein LOC114812935 n=1 Tax=Ornithorhynchus anatinus TaxID=9258 RepID=UPI0019D4541C|nr:uncharacterized protein LOC114812935 [Ornithorhynchus anatinus]